jgi:hypothetical protein
VAFIDDANFLGFVGDGEVRFTGNAGLDLDEVHPTAVQHIDRLSSIFRSGDGNGCPVMRCRAIQHGAGDDHAGAEQTVCGDLAAGVKHRIECAAHVADTGDAVSQQQRQHNIRSIGSGAVEVDVRVHIPQTGDEICSMRVDELCSLGVAPGAVLHPGDAIAIDDDGGVGLDGAAYGVDDVGVGNGKGLRLSGKGPQGQREEKFL